MMLTIEDEPEAVDKGKLERNGLTAVKNYYEHYKELNRIK
jgi:hypothetical protein